MYITDSTVEWDLIHEDDLWVYNKLFLSKKLGYLCGPTGVIVPKKGPYVVRPSFNLLGMGRYARIETLISTTDHLHPSEFWCEIFKGDHLSVDFYKKKSKLVVKGERDESDPLYKWKKWTKIDKEILFPSILENLKGSYDWINCEFIGNRLIEVHFRQNHDFSYENSVAIPIWEDQKIDEPDHYRYVRDDDYLRKGFLID